MNKLAKYIKQYPIISLGILLFLLYVISSPEQPLVSQSIIGTIFSGPGIGGLIAFIGGIAVIIALVAAGPTGGGSLIFGGIGILMILVGSGLISLAKFADSLGTSVGPMMVGVFILFVLLIGLKIIRR